MLPVSEHKGLIEGLGRGSHWCPQHKGRIQVEQPHPRMKLQPLHCAWDRPRFPDLLQLHSFKSEGKKMWM